MGFDIFRSIKKDLKTAFPAKDKIIISKWDELDKKHGSCGRCLLFKFRTKHTGNCALLGEKILGDVHLCSIDSFQSKTEEN